MTPILRLTEAHGNPEFRFVSLLRIAILVLVEGGTMREAGKRCGIKDSAALLLKRRIAADLIEFFGEEVIRRLLDGVRPGWESDLRTVRDRQLSLVANGVAVVQPSR